MRWLLLGLMAFTLMACEKTERVGCRNVDMGEYTPQELKLLTEACGSRPKPPEPALIEDRVSMAAKRAGMTEQAFVASPVGQIMLDQETERLWSRWIALAFATLVIWVTVGWVIYTMLRSPSKADYVKGKVQIREWHSIKQDLNGELGAAAWIVGLAAVLTLGLYVKLA